MEATKRLTIETVNLDDQREVRAFHEQVIESGIKRVQANRAELRARGLLDENGNLISTELPSDMMPGSERDFGG